MNQDFQTVASDLPAAAVGKDPATVSGVRRFISYPATLLVTGIALMIAAAAAASVIGHWIPQGKYDPATLVVAMIAVAIFIALYYVLVHWVERAPFRDLAVRGGGRELASGILLGAGLFTLVVAIAAAIGVYSIGPVNPWQTIWPMLAMAIFSGVSEEILFRGIIFRYVERMAGSWIALLISAAIFGGAHLANPNASPIAAIAIAIEAGLLLGAVYMLTRRLWAAIGLHAAWNFTQGWIFGVPVSGTKESGIIEGQLDGATLLTGGGFGLEASIIAMVVATAAGVIVLTLAIRRGRLVAPSWRRRSSAAPVFT